MDAPRILVVSTQPWNFGARTAWGLSAAGCRVEAACPKGALLDRSSLAIPRHRLRQRRMAGDLAAVLRASRFDRVVPCDDVSAALVAGLHAEPELRALVEVSLGQPASYGTAGRKSQQMALAAEMGLPTPPTRPVADEAALREALAAGGLPRVLKTDGSWGGAGVIIIRDAAEAASAWRLATTRPGWSQTAKLAAWERSIRPFVARRGWRPGTPDLQDFVAGAPANRAVLCEQGRILAGLSVEVLHSISGTGPASVVRVIDHPQMTRTAEAMVARLGLSGFLGFDFVLRADTGEALLLEMNPRATPICHLTGEGGAGGLTAALARHLTGGDPAAVPLPAVGETIALFPGEWMRDAASPYLAGRHDVPWQDMALMRAYLDDAEAAATFDRLRARLRRWTGR